MNVFSLPGLGTWTCLVSGFLMRKANDIDPNDFPQVFERKKALLVLDE